MKITRRTLEVERPDGVIARATSETTRTGFWDALFAPRRRERLVLNGDVWAVERRTYTGTTYQAIRSATPAELIAHAEMNVNPQTAPALIRGRVIA